MNNAQVTVLVVSLLVLLFGCHTAPVAPTSSTIKTRLIIEYVEYPPDRYQATSIESIVEEHDFLEQTLCGEVLFVESAIEYTDRLPDDGFFEYCAWYSSLYPNELCIFYLFPRIEGISGLTSKDGYIMLFPFRASPTLLHEFGHVVGLEHASMKNWTKYYTRFDDWVWESEMNVMHEYVGERNALLTPQQRAGFRKGSQQLEASQR